MIHHIGCFLLLPVQQATNRLMREDQSGISVTEGQLNTAALYALTE